VEAHTEHPAAVSLTLVRPPRLREMLYYGFGGQPSCDLVDELDMAALASGP